MLSDTVAKASTCALVLALCQVTEIAAMPRQPPLPSDMDAAVSQSPPSASPLEVDYARSRVVAKLKKGGLLRFLGHEHGIVPGGWSAEVVFDERDLDGSRVVVEVSVPDLIIDSPEARRLAGVDPDGPNDEEVGEIHARMLGDGQLDAAEFPTIRFESTRIMRNGPGGLELEGNLTIHGVSRRVDVDADLERSGSGYAVRGDFAIEQRDFDIEPVSIGGVVKVGNEVDISFEIFLERLEAPRK